jgi:hypothetical protein
LIKRLAARAGFISGPGCPGTYICIHLLAAGGITLARHLDDGVGKVVFRIGHAQGRSRKGRGFLAVDNHGYKNVLVVQFGQVDSLKYWFKVTAQDSRVAGADAERHHRTDVSEDSVADDLGHLRDVLVGDGQVEAILARL